MQSFAIVARGHGPRSHGFEYRSLFSRFGTGCSLRSGALLALPQFPTSPPCTGIVRSA